MYTNISSAGVRATSIRPITRPTSLIYALYLPPKPSLSRFSYDIFMLWGDSVNSAEGRMANIRDKSELLSFAIVLVGRPRRPGCGAYTRRRGQCVVLHLIGAARATLLVPVYVQPVSCFDEPSSDLLLSDVSRARSRARSTCCVESHTVDMRMPCDGVTGVMFNLEEVPHAAYKLVEQYSPAGTWTDIA